MEKKIAKHIVKNCVKEWNKRGKKIDPGFPEFLEKTLLDCPDEDGNKRVTMFGTDDVHLVPYEHMILNGLQGTEVENFPIEKKK